MEGLSVLSFSELSLPPRPKVVVPQQVALRGALPGFLLCSQRVSVGPSALEGGPAEPTNARHTCPL